MKQPTENVDTNIYRSNAQLMNLDPATVKPVLDRVLVRDIPEPERIGSIVIPQGLEIGVGKKGLLRLGVVVAVGPGDKYFNWVERGKERKRAMPDCPVCNGRGKNFNAVLYENVSCGPCNGTGLYRPQMQVIVGDKIVYDRRKEAEVYINNERFALIHEMQSILAVIEEN